MLPTLKTFVLLAAMTALFMGVGGLIGGQAGALIALMIAAGMNLFAWWGSDQMVLRMNNARAVSRSQAPELHTLVEGLARNAGLPTPAVYLIDTDQPNAFATGRSPDHAAVAVTRGLMSSLSREELSGVIAHELAHIRHRDTLTMAVTATLAGAISMIANFAFFFRMGNRNGPGLIETLALMILAPLSAALVQMAISRTREYEADRAGAEICGNPLWLASALGKIEALARGRVNPYAEAAPAMAHMYISNPLSGRSMDNLFATHPSTENRIAALREIAGRMGSAGYTSAPVRRSAAPSQAAPVRADRPSSIPRVRRGPRGPWG